MTRHIREDLVHGMRGDMLRSTPIIIAGDGLIGAELRMLFAKAGYQTLTLVMRESMVTRDMVCQDAMLKLEDLGVSRIDTIRKRFKSFSTANDPVLRIIDLNEFSASDLKGHDFLVMADRLVPAIEDICRGRIPFVFGVATASGYRVDYLPGCSVTKRLLPEASSACLPINSLMTATYMMTLLQKLTLREMEDTVFTNFFSFPDTYKVISGPDEDIQYENHPPITHRRFDFSVTVVGCGAIGSHVTLLLAKLGFTRVSLIDFDEIREHNLSRLALSEVSDIGRSKAAMLCERVEERYGLSYSYIEKEVEYIPEGRLMDHHLILCCSDRNSARRYLAGISRMKDEIVFIQGGFGKGLHQITTGSEIDSIFSQDDTLRNSCTGLSISKEQSEPVGSTQATVGMVAAAMVEAALRVLHGDRTCKDRFFTWGFPKLVHTLHLDTNETVFPNVTEVFIPDGKTTVRHFLQKVDEYFPGHFIMSDHTFVVGWECLVCRKYIRVHRYLHHLNDANRFHETCLVGNEQLLHANIPQKRIEISDRLSLESDDDILSMSIEEIGIMEDSVRMIYSNEGLIGAVRVKYTPAEHFSLVIEESVLTAMKRHGLEIMKASGHEAVGLLFGRVVGDTVQLIEFVPAEVGYSTPYYVQISGEWMARILYEYEGSAMRLCGWWHTHPGFGLSPSGRDIETFKYFSAHNQFSLIQDPTATENGLAIYQFSDGKVFSRDYCIKAKDGKLVRFKKYSHGQ
jgi:molybdopterin/thiamine biosynthesis adenylyltransferase/proteasome lid subunit RPN8/RPN11